MSLHAFPGFETLSAPDAARSGYAAPYHNTGPVPRAFAVGSSLGADHLEHPQCPPRYFHARGTQMGAPSTGAARYTGTSSTTAPPRYATGVPISGYGAASFSSRPAGRTWDQDAPASAGDVQGLAVHGHASEALLALRYSAAAAASRSAPSPVTSSSSCSSGSGSSAFKSAEGGVLLASPTPLQPHSSEMAILLSGGELQHDEDSYYGDSAPPRAFNNNLRMPVAYALMNPDVCALPLEDDPDALEEGFLSREKKHGCTMCHKRFDRPSTLKKHLLVHTGEKAFQCTICERRFGVMSNLNRHIRRCSLREVHTHGSAASAPAPSSLDEKNSPPIVTGKRGRTPPPGSVDSAKAPAAPRKRRRRPPSPSRWIPASLRSFNILPPELTPAAEVPLAPVRPTYLCPNTVPGPQWEEERDSFDENVGRAPYHPSEWDKTCRLPGPAVVKFGGGIGGNYIGESDFGYDIYRSRSAIRVG